MSPKQLRCCEILRVPIVSSLSNLGKFIYFEKQAEKHVFRARVWEGLMVLSLHEEYKSLKKSHCPHGVLGTGSGGKLCI